MNLHDQFKEMMRRRGLWTDEMKETHKRRKVAVEKCLSALADLSDNDRYIVKDRLRDLFDIEDGELEPSTISEW